MEQIKNFSTQIQNIDNNQEEKDIYRIFEYFDYLLIEPKKGNYDFAIFFFSGFNENAGKYLNLYKSFFEKFSRKFNIKFKIYLPMLDVYSRDDYPQSKMINYEDDKQKKIYSWFNYKIEENKRVEFVTKSEKDILIKNLFDNEIKILKNTEKIIFIGFSMGGRYVLHTLEKFNIKIKFNLLFKSPIFIFKSKKKNENKINDNNINGDFCNYLNNKFYLIYSRNDKFCNFQDGIKSYHLLKDEFLEVNLKINNDQKHIVDYNCLEFLKDILLKELINIKQAKF